MKKLLILLLPIMLFSCEKEQITPNPPTEVSLEYTVNIEASGTIRTYINGYQVPTSTQYTLHTGDYIEIQSGPVGISQTMRVYINYQQVYNNFGADLVYTKQF